MVGVTRFELVTSSVSGKRSPPELNAQFSNHILVGQDARRYNTGNEDLYKTLFRKSFQSKTVHNRQVESQGYKDASSDQKRKSGRFLDR